MKVSLNRVVFLFLAGIWLLSLGGLIFILVASTMFGGSEVLTTVLAGGGLALFWLGATFIVPPFFLPWLVMLPLTFYLAWKKPQKKLSLADSMFTWLWGGGYVISSFLTLVLHIYCLNNCNNNDPVSANGFILLSLLTYIWWMPLLIYLAFKGGELLASKKK